jgi:hypothetical protein
MRRCVLHQERPVQSKSRQSPHQTGNKNGFVQREAHIRGAKFQCLKAVGGAHIPVDIRFVEMLPVSTSVRTRASYSARDENTCGLPAIGQRRQISVRKLE